MESNSLNGSSIQMMHSIELKFGMHIIGYHRTNPIDFGECCMHSFFERVQKIILVYYGPRCHFIVSVLVSKQYILLGSKLICV